VRLLDSSLQLCGSPRTDTLPIIVMEYLRYVSSPDYMRCFPSPPLFCPTPSTTQNRKLLYRPKRFPTANSESHVYSKTLLRVAAAGPYHNFLTYIVLLLLPFLGAQWLFYEDVSALGVYVTHVSDVSSRDLLGSNRD
jgi:hypothetical protein